MKKVTVLLILLLVLGLVFASTSLAESRKFRILAKPSSPFKISADASHPKPGISIEILRKIMSEMKIPVEFKMISSVARIVREAKTGRAEMLISFSKKNKRKEFLAYPEQFYRSIDWRFFIRKEDAEKIKFETFEDLKPYRIGVTKGVSYTKQFWDAQRFLKFDIYAVEKNQIPKLLAGRVDVIPMSTQSTLDSLKKKGLMDKVTYLPKPFKSKPYYDPVVKSSPFFKPPLDSGKTSQEMITEFTEKFDRILKRLITSGFVQSVYKKYGYDYLPGT